MGQLRHGGYQLNEFRDREAEIDVSSGKSYYYRKEELDRGRARYRRWTNDLERGRDGSIRVRVRVGQLDVQEQEMVNGKFLSSPNVSYPVGKDDRRRKQNGRAIREVDREPGELSSGSGTDESDVFNSRSMENQGLSSKDAARRKRKFSCVARNVEDRQANISSLNNNGIADSIFPSPRHSSDETRASMSEQNSLSNSECSPLCPGTAPGSMRFIAVEPLAGSSSVSPSQREQDKVQDKEQSVEGNHDFSRKLSASRWANEHGSPRNEGEISEDESESKRKKPVILVESVWSRRNSKDRYPELGELTAEDSERARSRSSGFSGDGSQSHLASDDEVQLNGNGCMELDEEEGSENACVHQSELDSLPVDDSNGAASARSFNMLHGCRSVNDFEKLNKINEGTYGIVFRARDKKSGEVVALKKVKMEKEREGFPLTSLREINILLSCRHPSIVDLREVVIGRDINQVFMVMEYMEHDLKGLMDAVEQPFSQSEVKCLMLQLLEGVHYLHDNWIIHRDLKTSNLLLNNRGELKICDFGLARQYGSPLKPYTQLVVTLWYRAPELLLGARKYSTAVDMWSLGCIMSELLAKEPLFSGKSEIDQLDKIFKTLGTPTKNIWPGFTMLPGARVKYTKQPYNNLRKKFPRASFTGRSVLSEAGFDLLNNLLTYDPEKRITAEDALNHEWFREVPLPKSIDFMSAIPAQYAQDRRLR